MSKINEVSSDKTVLSFVSMTDSVKKFDGKAYRKYIKDLTYSAFLCTPYESETYPIQITLDTPHNPMSRGQFSADYFDTYTFVRINTFGQGGTSRVYMKDVPAVIEALTKAKEAYDTIREAGVRDFPTIPGFEEWQALQENSSNAWEAEPFHIV